MTALLSAKYAENWTKSWLLSDSHLSYTICRRIERRKQHITYTEEY